MPHPFLPGREFWRQEVNERPDCKDYSQLKDEPRIFSKNDILNWFLECNLCDAQWVLSTLSKQRSELFDSFQGERQERISITSLRSEHEEGEFSRTRSVYSLNDAEVKPILQFSSPVFFAEEYEGEITIDVIRIGSSEGLSTVSFKTEDESAFAGESYEEISGALTFMPGESTQHVTVKLMPNESWNTTTEFKLILTEEGLSGGALGQYLFQTRIKIIDQDVFPTNVFQGVDWSGDCTDISKTQLLIEYFKMTWNNPRIRYGTIQTVLVDLFLNIALMLRLFAGIYLLDYILNDKRPTSELLFFHHRDGCLILLSAFHLVLLFLSHLFEYWKPSFAMNGPAKAFMKNALLRKFLHYTRGVRESSEPADILMAINRDSVEVVLHGYDNCLKLLHLTGKIFCMMLFELISLYTFGHIDNFKAAAVMVVVPVVLALFLHIRSKSVSEVLDYVHKTENKVANHIGLTLTNYNLVFDYNLRNFASGRFGTLVAAHGKACRANVEVMINNEYFAKWVTLFAIAGYAYFGGLLVLKGDLSLGVFVASLKVYKTVGTACQTIFATLVNMQTVLPSILSLSRFLNLPTDVAHRKHLKRIQRKRAADMRDSLLHSSDLHGAAVDALPIKLDLRDYRFGENLNFNGVIEIKQGQLVAVIGKLGTGKATLLRLISGAILPKEDQGHCVFIPAHLRVVNVQEVPLFYGGTLFENVAFGISAENSDAARERVYGICDKLGIEERVKAFLESKEEAKWPELISGAQCKLLMIARALINNAELICFHKPLQNLDHEQSKHVMVTLHQHVVEKGIMQKANSLMRRPRSVFISSSYDHALDLVHQKLQVSHDSGMELLQK